MGHKLFPLKEKTYKQSLLIYQETNQRSPHCLIHKTKIALMVHSIERVTLDVYEAEGVFHIT